VDRCILMRRCHRHSTVLLMGSVTTIRRSLWPGTHEYKGAANLLHLARDPKDFENHSSGDCS